MTPINAYETDRNRAALALVVGAAAGALIITAIMLALVYLTGSAADGRIMLFEPGKFAVLFYIAALGVFAIGLLAVGAPLWLLFHRLDCRSWVHAVVVGFFGAMIGGALLHSLAIPDSLLPGPAPDILWISIVGAMVGFIVWRIAYRRVPVPP